MLIDAAKKALGELFDPALRGVLWKSIGLTILALILLWNVISFIFANTAVPFLSGWISGFFALPNWTGTLGFIAAIFAGLGLAVGLAFLIGPVSAAIAGFFLDDVADHVERQDYSADVPGTAMPLGPSIVMSLRFFGLVIAGNIVALFLLLIPGINLIAFFLVNGYLLGREYFQFAALRHHDLQTVTMLRAKHSGTIIMAGFLIAAVLAVPVVNLLTPLFGAALMVHLTKAITAREQLTRSLAAAVR